MKGLNAEDHKEIFMDTFSIMIVLLVTDRMYLPFKSGEFSCTVCKLYLNKSDPPPNPKTQKGINHHKLSRARTEVEGLDSHNYTYTLEAGLQGVRSTRLRKPTRADTKPEVGEPQSQLMTQNPWQVQDLLASRTSERIMQVELGKGRVFGKLAESR